MLGSRVTLPTLRMRAGKVLLEALATSFPFARFSSVTSFTTVFLIPAVVLRLGSGATLSFL